MKDSLTYWSSAKTTFLASKAYYERVGRALDLYIVPLIRDRKPRTFLDLGCGNGHYTFQLASGVPNVTACDVSSFLIDEARKAAIEKNINNIYFYTIDTGNQHWFKEKYDLVACMGVTSVIIDSREFNQTCRRLARSVSPGGFLILRDSLSTNERGEKILKKRPSYYRYYLDYLNRFMGFGLSVKLVIKLNESPVRKRVNYLVVLKKPRTSLGRFLARKFGRVPPSITMLD